MNSSCMIGPCCMGELGTVGVTFCMKLDHVFSAATGVACQGFADEPIDEAGRRMTKKFCAI